MLIDVFMNSSNLAIIDYMHGHLHSKSDSLSIRICHVNVHVRQVPDLLCNFYKYDYTYTYVSVISIQLITLQPCTLTVLIII